MVQEEHLEWAGRGALTEQARNFPQTMLVIAASASDSEAGRANPSPLLEEVNWMAAAATNAPRVLLHPWKVAARAKGRPGYFLAKRCLDVMLAVVALLVCSPLIIGVALLVRLTSPGPVLFRQERVGYGGRRFTIYKFRSMYMNCDDRLHRAAYEQFLRGERPSGKVDHNLLVQPQMKQSIADSTTTPARRKHSWMAGDPRITPLGYLLRQSSIDELPQFLNVLRGEMSLVGPRPPIPYEVGMYQPQHMERLDTLPGITGLWQVQGRSRVSFEQMVEMDREYIQKQSFWYDLKLLVLTIPAVLSRKGAG